MGISDEGFKEILVDQVRDSWVIFMGDLEDIRGFLVNWRKLRGMRPGNGDGYGRQKLTVAGGMKLLWAMGDLLFGRMKGKLV
ncbi:hypothetical protein Ddye_016437 [Dipteronia dyeriana]|uniref:Uncharacterized protein n=1 Tax=Dipteronia dyeriana TaxID=168575 RepID=A0AAD9X028_9ROSI|nr:hypothetical protein Ddye_016437 [Dipteronia dyeriana]